MTSTDQTNLRAGEKQAQDGPQLWPADKPPASLEEAARHMFAIYLGQCHNQIQRLIRRAGEAQSGAEEMQYSAAAAKMIHTSIDLVNSLRRECGETRHRVIVEHASGEGPL